jgi:hypothetical protein
MAKKRNPDHELLRINTRRIRIQDALGDASLYHTTLTTDTLRSVTQVIRKAVKLRPMHDDAIRESLLDFVGKELTTRIGDMLSLRIAGGWQLLSHGQPIQPYAGSNGESVPLEITELRFDRIRNGKVHLELRTVAMAGSAVGVEFKQSVPRKFIVYKLAHDLGWPRSAHAPAHSELVRMWFTGTLGRARNKMVIATFDCKPHQQQYNKQLRGERAKACIRDYQFQCRACPIGYESCARATHRYTWVQKPCVKCGATQAWFDPEDIMSKICLRCKVKPMHAVWALEQRHV